MANISQQKRQKMIEFLNKLKQAHQDDDILRALGEIETALNEKKYGLVWEKHREKVDEMLEHNIPIFKEVEERKIVSNDKKEYNFLLEGDNLHSLKLLEKTHKGKIDVIYIDPPYNTGNKDFIYNDSFVDKTDGYSHSKWLSFMEERLIIAKELLSDEGVIFISIDDNEQAQLKLLCDEVFGENLVETNIWSLIDKSESTFEKTAGYTTRKEHEYLITCRKNKNIKFKKYKDVVNFNNNSFSNPDNDPRGDWFSGNISRTSIKTTTGSKYYTIKSPSGVEYSRNWTLSKEEYEEAIKKNRIYFPKNGEGVPRYKIFKTDTKETIQSSIFYDLKTSISGKNQLKDVLGYLPFDYPKPIELITRILTITSKDNSIILDFFAGSGTTGHTVMQLNKEDGGNRRYILCTNNENNICEEVTYQRLKNIQSELPHNLKYFKTDFISKYEDEETEKTISEKMLEHIKELIELEHHIEIDNEKYIILYNEEECEKVLENIKDGAKLFINSGIFLSRFHQRILDEKNVVVVDIPEYYHRKELKEVGEL